MALDRVARSAKRRGPRQVATCVVEAMHGRSDLRVHERCARRVIGACESRGERLEAVEGVEVPEELRGQAFMIDNHLGNTRSARISRETRPRAAPCAGQIDRGDLAVRRDGTGTIKLCVRAHSAPRNGGSSFRDRS